MKQILGQYNLLKENIEKKVKEFNNKKIEKEDFDIDEKFKKQITFERNRKLNEFSRQYFKKIKINQQIE